MMGNLVIVKGMLAGVGVPLQKSRAPVVTQHGALGYVRRSKT